MFANKYLAKYSVPDLNLDQKLDSPPPAKKRFLDSNYNNDNNNNDDNNNNNENDNKDDDDNNNNNNNGNNNKDDNYNDNNSKNNNSNNKCSSCCSFKYYIKSLECTNKKLDLENISLKEEINALKREKEEQDNNILLMKCINEHSGKKILEKQIGILKDINSNLIKQVNKLQNDILENSKNKENYFDKKIQNLSENLKIIIKNAIENAGKCSYAKRYSTEVKTVALATYFLSPLSYRNLKVDMDWPDARTLQEFTSEWPKTPGLNRSHLQLLQMRANELTDEQKYVTICCDEMSLKVHMYYDRKFDKIVGLEDYGVPV